MNILRHFNIAWITVCIGLLLASPGAICLVHADDLVASQNPYTAIVGRNLFSLVPVPTNNPDDNKPVDPPAKIVANGIMSLFGSLQVLFKVTPKPPPGQAPQDVSYTMGEGDRQDGISVIKIDEAAGVVTFDNNGVVQKIPLEAGVASTGSPVGGDSSGGTGRSLSRRFGRPDRNGPPPGQDGGSVAASSGTAPYSPEAVQANINNALNDPNHLSPEAQVLVMEAQRSALQQQGDPMANLIPPTALTGQAPTPEPEAPGAR